MAGTVVIEVATSQQFDLSFTSPAAPSTVVETIITGLDLFHSAFLYAHLVGATGGVLDIFLQVSVDLGVTWTDYAHFPQIAAAAAAIDRIWAISKSAQQITLQTVGIGTAPLLAANTIIGGDWGDRMRAVAVAGALTTAGAAQILKLFFSS